MYSIRTIFLVLSCFIFLSCHGDLNGVPEDFECYSKFGSLDSNVQIRFKVDDDSGALATSDSDQFYASFKPCPVRGFTFHFGDSIRIIQFSLLHVNGVGVYPLTMKTRTDTGNFGSYATCEFRPFPDYWYTTDSLTKGFFKVTEFNTVDQTLSGEFDFDGSRKEYHEYGIINPNIKVHVSGKVTNVSWDRIGG